MTAYANSTATLPPPPPDLSLSSSLPKPLNFGQHIGSKPTLITQPPMRFLIMDAPRQSNLHLYIRECSRHGVTDIVRVCEPTYAGDKDLKNAGIELHEMAYDDGTSPPRDVIERWLDLVHGRFYKKNLGGAREGGASVVTPVNTSPTIAVHCVAGLGRAPVLVAIALIEFKDMDPVDAVTFIRSHRRGAINEKQLIYLERYRKWYKKGGSVNSGCACTIL